MPDIRRGGVLFKAHCGTCHQFKGEGISVGPPLDGEAGRPAESLLADVLNPSGEITAGYGTYIAKLKGGVEHTGVLSSESATSISLIKAAGSEEGLFANQRKAASFIMMATTGLVYTVSCVRSFIWARKNPVVATDG